MLIAVFKTVYDLTNQNIGWQVKIMYLRNTSIFGIILHWMHKLSYIWSKIRATLMLHYKNLFFQEIEKKNNILSEISIGTFC